MTQAGGREIGFFDYALVAGIGAFVLLKLPFVLPRFSDGNAYLYMAKLAADGAIPYRDFFFASPPGLLYLFALAGLIFGFSWRVFSFFPIFLSAVDAILIFLLARRLFSSAGGVVAALLYLFSFVTLATSDFYSGVHSAVTLALAGLFLQQRGRAGASGFLYAAAALVKLYAGVLLAAAMAAAALERRWREVGRLLAGGALIALLVVGAFWRLAGEAFFADVVLNHLAKTAGIPKGRIAWFFVQHDAVLAAAVFLPLLLRRWPPRWVYIPVLFVGVYFVLFRDVYYLHLKMLVVWLAILWGWGIWQLQQRAPRLALSAAVVVVALTAGVSSFRYVREQAQAAVVSNFDEVVAAVQNNVPPGGVLYGDYSVTPLLALAANRTVYRNYADVNPAYFLSGLFDYEARAQELREANVQTIITKANVSSAGLVLGGHEAVLPAAFFSHYCRAARVFPLAHDYEHNALVLWQCTY